MNALQVYGLVNDLIKEGVGAQNITVKDVGGLVSFGESILSDDSQKDAMYKKLHDRIGRTYIKYRRYYADNQDAIMRTPMDFGVILQKVQVLHIGEMEENASFKNQGNPFYTESDSTSFTETLFKAFGTFQTKPKLIYDTQLNSAFTSAEAFGAFVNMIYNDMYNSMEVAIENLIKTTKATMMGNALSEDSEGKTSRNLLAEYLVANPNATITAANCLTDVDFLKFASREINLTRKRFNKMSRMFNSLGADRFTEDSELEVEVLADYATATASYLDADTYHNELVKLPNYREVSSWQGDSDFTFAEVSKIDVAIGTEGEEDYLEMTQSGIIAAIYDREACGISIFRPRVVSMYNSIQEVNNVTYKLQYGSFVDKSENCVVFYIADAAIDNGGSENSTPQADTRTIKANFKKLAK